MRPHEQPDFLIRLRPVAGDRLAVVHLRRILKALLRGYRLRCIDAREVPADDGQVDRHRQPPASSDET